MYSIAVANNKGGVSKTTLTISLAYLLAKAGKSVLVLDLDPRGDATNALGVDHSEENHGIASLLMGQGTVEECTHLTANPFIFVVPADYGIDDAIAHIKTTRKNPMEALPDAVVDIITHTHYDFVISDCRPDVDLLMMSALTMSDTVLIPVSCEYLPLRGLASLLEVIYSLDDLDGETVTIAGIVPTMFDSRTTLATEVLDGLKSFGQGNLIEVFPPIPRSTIFARSAKEVKPFFQIPGYRRKTHGAAFEKILATIGETK